MPALLSSTIFRGVLGFVQVMGIVAAGAAAQQQPQLKSIKGGKTAGGGVLAANGLPAAIGLNFAVVDGAVHYVLHAGTPAGSRRKGWPGE
jgi:hypothetical protein